MPAVEIPLLSPSITAVGGNRWCLFLLDHLTEFATLAWYLIADGKLVEEAFSRSITQLEHIPFDDSPPALAYHQARDIIISQAIAVLSEARSREGVDQIASSIFPIDFPDLSRLAFMLRLVICRSEEEVARLLAVTPSEVRELVSDAIHYISASAPCKTPTGCPEA